MALHADRDDTTTNFTMWTGRYKYTYSVMSYSRARVLVRVFPQPHYLLAMGNVTRVAGGMLEAGRDVDDGGMGSPLVDTGGAVAVTLWSVLWWAGMVSVGAGGFILGGCAGVVNVGAGGTTSGGT